MPNKRSLSSLQKRAAKRFLLNTAFNDPFRAEKVCTVNRDTLIRFLQEQFNSVSMDAVNFLRGEVLVDSRGTGSLQTTLRR
ncbi:MAG: hypothetical protein DRJ03_04115 [Chloroflexi bacterium]|nr:MAG: hypothetical protein DRJ03_04115 [Chloroflexota bacterium]